MSARITTAALAFAALAWAIPAGAQAVLQPVPPRDIPWFMAHPHERQLTLKICTNDMRYINTPDCLNAHEAESRLVASRYQGGANLGTHHWPSLEAMSEDPVYWAETGIGLAGTVQVCSSGGPTLMSPKQCAAARAGLALLNSRQGK